MMVMMICMIMMLLMIIITVAVVLLLISLTLLSKLSCRFTANFVYLLGGLVELFPTYFTDRLRFQHK